MATASDDIHCICGFTHDDGFSIACDDCGRWSHMICFDILPGHDPDEWRCWECMPRDVDRRRAIRRQEERLEQRLGLQAAGGGPSRRRRERRTSMNTGHHNHNNAPPLSAHSTDPHHEDEHVDIEDEWQASFVPLANDIIPHASTREKLHIVAQNWRGVTALMSEPRKTRVVPLPSPKDDVAAAVRPPSFALQTTAPIAGEALITPFTSTIVPSAAYLSDPLNAYAHLGMPKPHVHLVPPPLSVALDARMVGNEARFVRSGCRPNAVLRPVLCPKRPKKRASSDVEMNGRMGSASETEGEDEGVGASEDDDPGVLKFAIFALRDLKACEEIVLGWEWDDGAVVHHLPALIEEGARAGPSKMTPQYIARLRLQMQSIVHSLKSSFVTCACGNAARDCALRLMETFADGEYPLPVNGQSFEYNVTKQQRIFRERVNAEAGPSRPSSYNQHSSLASTPPQSPFPLNKHPSSLQDLSRKSKVKAKTKTQVDLGPLIGARRGVRTRVIGGEESGGMRGVELIEGDRWDRFGELDVRDDSRVRGTSLPALHVVHPTPQKGERRGSSREFAPAGRDRYTYPGHVAPPLSSRSPSPYGERVRCEVHEKEERMPPKMRKRWIHQKSEKLRSEAQALRVASADEAGADMDVDGHGRSISVRSTPTSTTPTPNVGFFNNVREGAGRMDIDHESLQMPPPPAPPLTSLRLSPKLPTPPPPPSISSTNSLPSRRPSTLFSLLNEQSVSPLHSSKHFSYLRLGQAAPEPPSSPPPPPPEAPTQGPQEDEDDVKQQQQQPLSEPKPESSTSTLVSAEAAVADKDREKMQSPSPPAETSAPSLETDEDNTGSPVLARSAGAPDTASEDESPRLPVEDELMKAVRPGVVVEAGNSLHLTEQPSPSSSPLPLPSPSALVNAMDVDLHLEPAPADAEIPDSATKTEQQAPTLAETATSPGPAVAVARSLTPQPTPNSQPLPLPKLSVIIDSNEASTSPFSALQDSHEHEPEPDSLAERQAILAAAAAGANINDNANTLRLPSPTVSVASSSDVGRTSPSCASLAPPEPPKIRRSMADYKQRKRKQREEEAAKAAVVSPVTPVTPLHHELPVPGSTVDENANANEDSPPVGGDEAGRMDEVKTAETRPVEGIQESPIGGKLDDGGDGEVRTSKPPPAPVGHTAASRDNSATQPAVQARPRPSPTFQATTKRELSEERVDFSPSPSIELDSMGPAAMEVDDDHDHDRNDAPPQAPGRDTPSNGRRYAHPMSIQERIPTPQPEEDGEITSAHSRLTAPPLPRGPLGRGRKCSATPAGSSGYIPHRALQQQGASGPPRQPRSLRVQSASPQHAVVRPCTPLPPPVPTPGPQHPKLPGWAQRERERERAAASGGEAAAQGGSALLSAPLPGTSNGGGGGRPPPPSGPRALRDSQSQSQSQLQLQLQLQSRLASHGFGLERAGRVQQPTLPLPAAAPPPVPLPVPVLLPPLPPPPRGPLADRERSRDRDRERERDRDRHSPPRGRPPGWTRTWGRGRR